MAKGGSMVAYIAGPSAIEIRSGVVHVRDRSGAQCIERTMSVKVLADNVKRGERALARFASGEENIVVDD